mgnify:FL=1
MAINRTIDRSQQLKEDPSGEVQHIAFPPRNRPEVEQPSVRPKIQPQAPQAKTEVEKDPENAQIVLPSGFVPYTFKELSVKPILGIHQAKFNTAARLGSTRTLVDCISSLLPEGISALDLTVSDFRWLLYYLRTVNFANTPLIMTATCRDPEHLAKVQRKELPESTLKTISTLNRSTLEEKDLDIALLEELVQSEPELDSSELGFATMRDTLEIIEAADKYASDEEREEQEFLMELA